MSSQPLVIGKFSLGMGDRFAHEAEAQLAACLAAKKLGVEIVPVWNKSNREHNIIGSEPTSTRAAADAAVKALGWTAPYFLDADHIGLKTVERFVGVSDFFTIDVADFIAQPADPAAVKAFVDRHPELVGTITLAGQLVANLTPSTARALGIACLLTGGFMGAEIAGGVISGSLALLADAQAPATARLQALWSLDGLASARAEDVRLALKDTDAQVRAAAVRLAPAEMLADLCALKDEQEVIVLAHLAIRLSAVNQPAADRTLADLLARHGKNALIREGALSGARGREVALAQAVAKAATRANLAETGPVLEALAALVSQAGKGGPFEQMLAVAVTLDDRTNLRDAVLRGLDQTIRDAKTKKTSPLKTIWLSSEPAPLAKLRATVKSSGGLTNLTSLSSRLAWMGKPGAPAPPKVTALTKVELERFDKGKVIFTTLCAPCHQPHGYGLDGLAPPLVDSDWVLGKPDVTAKIVLNGLGGPIKVGNRTWDLSMPPMGMLSDEDVASVLTYIRREWEHNGSPVDAKFVAGVRKQSADHPNSWTADELRPPTKKTAQARAAK